MSAVGRGFDGATDLLTMQWRDVLFAHWRVNPEVVEKQLPSGVTVATYNGNGFLGIVPFKMADIRPRGSPIGRSFPELNLRTYVRQLGSKTHGVYFFNLDADDTLGVEIARRGFKLPYYHADMELSYDTTDKSEDKKIHIASQRTQDNATPARFEATYGPVNKASYIEPTPGSLTAFLTENYQFYTDGRRLYQGTIRHSPWKVAEGHLTIEENTLFTANGFEHPTEGPVVHYAPGTDVTAGWIQSVGDS
ncbi:YqjF family protein [Haloquadratum walsbyi]|nr:DUF2071 domain-containing protein [Haloquadratum walsbyi]